MERAKHYLDLNRKYLEEGESLLVKGDSAQASEKLWGASAEIVKAVAVQRGLELKTHADLWSFTTKLSSELGDPEILTFFAAANYLHQNFYENAMTLEAVKASAQAVKKFIKKVEKLLTKR
ncbi:MAG: PaREP1 family protein [archaeon]|nr:PaREP1 family protein [archaeon]MCP8317180.1 PaREP1 family protein [archaeon]